MNTDKTKRLMESGAILLLALALLVVGASLYLVLRESAFVQNDLIAPQEGMSNTIQTTGLSTGLVPAINKISFDKEVSVTSGVKLIGLVQGEEGREQLYQIWQIFDKSQNYFFFKSFVVDSCNSFRWGTSTGALLFEEIGGCGPIGHYDAYEYNLNLEPGIEIHSDDYWEFSFRRRPIYPVVNVSVEYEQSCSDFVDGDAPPTTHSQSLKLFSNGKEVSVPLPRRLVTCQPAHESEGWANPFFDEPPRYKDGLITVTLSGGIHVLINPQKQVPGAAEEGLLNAITIEP